MKKTFIFIGLLSIACASLHAQNKTDIPVYLDDKQPLEVRVQDALKRMTLEEKTRLSYAQGKFSSPGCPRLGIPELWMSDGPHGVRAEINWNDWGYAGWTSDSCTAITRPSGISPVVPINFGTNSMWPVTHPQFRNTQTWTTG